MAGLLVFSFHQTTSEPKAVAIHHSFNMQAGTYDSMKDVSLKILQNSVSTVPIIHSASQDGSFPQLLNLASLSGILKCICRYFRHSAGSLPILQQPICSIPLGTWVPKLEEPNRRPLAMLGPNASLGAALSLLAQGSAIGSECKFFKCILQWTEMSDVFAD
ncbi:hypothetical protein POPTR_005G029300v4 [Populus trichocarpa]|uniref:CBS domain-containing protein n=1 Tax=Populus trichocarpa TaxID=3694 RepID=A0A3N7EZW6_POPTR|nr:hypothetical protein POPTR_005G029300v4 [Populus trichocarpa]